MGSCIPVLLVEKYVLKAVYSTKASSRTNADTAAAFMAVMTAPLFWFSAYA
jgi:hypothetical protein